MNNFLYPEDGEAALCDVCLGEIYSGDLVHVIDGYIVCPECFFDFAFDYFEDRMVYGGELKEMFTNDTYGNGSTVQRWGGKSENAGGRTGKTRR